MNNSVCILFEKINIANVIISFRSIKRSNRAILFSPYTFSKVKNSTVMTKIAIWLVKTINPSIEISGVDKETFLPLAYIDNYESEACIDEIARQICEMPSWRLALDIVGSDIIKRIYKGCLLDLILPVSQFYRYAKKIISNDQCVIIVPSDKRCFDIHRYFFDEKEFQTFTTKSIRFFINFKQQIKRKVSTLFLFNSFLVIRGVGYHLVKRMFNILSKDSRPKASISADVIMPLIWGFAKEDKLDGRTDEVIKARKVDWDNSFIFNEKLSKSQAAFFFGDWTFTPVARAKQCELMDRRGIKYFDPSEFCLDSKHLLLIWRTAIKMIKFIVLNPRIFIEPSCVTNISGRIIYRYLEEMLFNSRINYQVYVEWADYSYQSVMRTIVANSFGRTTAGIHHNDPDGPYGFPYIRYTYINRLCLWGNAMRRMFGRHWDVMDCHIVGIPRLDAGFRVLHPDRLKELKNHYCEHFGENGSVVLVLLPNPPKEKSYQIQSRFDEFLSGLLRCCEELPLFRIVFRPKRAEHWKIYREYEQIRKIEASKRAVIDLKKFSTYEWIAISDLVIANSISSVVIEASRMGRKCFTFDSMGLAEIVFKNYGKDLILKTADDVFNAISGLFNDFKNISYDWEHFAEDYCAFMDGNNTARFRDVICQGIS